MCHCRSPNISAQLMANPTYFVAIRFLITSALHPLVVSWGRTCNGRYNVSKKMERRAMRSPDQRITSGFLSTLDTLSYIDILSVFWGYGVGRWNEG